MNRQLQPYGHSGGDEITKPDALLVVDSTGSYYAGERLSDREVEQLRFTHKVSEIIWGEQMRIAQGKHPR
jgi:hypothetical protein